MHMSLVKDCLVNNFSFHFLLYFYYDITKININICNSYRSLLTLDTNRAELEYSDYYPIMKYVNCCENSDQ